MGISAYRLAVELHVSPPTVNDIVPEKRGITPEMAARLAKYFGTSELFWLNLQDPFAVHQVRRKYSKELKAIRPRAGCALEVVKRSSGEAACADFLWKHACPWLFGFRPVQNWDRISARGYISRAGAPAPHSNHSTHH